MATWNSFEEIEVWQLARDFCKEIFNLINETDLKSDYKLKDQVNGSSGSIMDNIAEGFERGGNKEFIQFLVIAKGSAGESRSQLIRIFDRGYIIESKFVELKNKTIEISAKLGALINYLKKSEYKGQRYK